MASRGEKTQAEILAILNCHDRPLSAYDILAKMRETVPKIAPPTVYRALTALMNAGRVHRLESLSAYIPSTSKAQDEAAILAICDDCGTVQENTPPDLVKTLSGILGKSGFEAQRHVIEVHGTCGTCDPEEERP